MAMNTRNIRWRAAQILFALFLGAGFSAAQDHPKPATLQNAADRAMAGRAGALVVADVATGSLLASHNLDVAAGRLARPGSTVKPFVLAALLESGKLNAEQRFACRRMLRIAGLKMDCTHPEVADLNAEEALAYSCNSFFAEMATRLTAAELVQALRRAGLDGSSGFVKAEATGQ